MARCVWDKAWSGRCQNTAITPFNDFISPDLCADHSGRKCSSCGGYAVRDCDHTGIQFVCGAPLCATCQHGFVMPGENRGMFNLGGGHITKEQWTKDWPEYERRWNEVNASRTTSGPGR